MNTNGHYKDHNLAAILPLMEDSEIRELSEDILAHGLRTPIVLYENKILDGRNRYRACNLVNVEPKIRQFTSGDPLAFIMSANVHRRHLTESQRALVAAKIANLKPGRPTQEINSANLPIKKSNAQAAKDLSVSERSVRTAKEVLAEAPKKDIAAIESGKKTVSGVAKEIAKAKAAKPAQHLDKTGYPIPETILEDWDRAAAFDKNLREISRIKGELSRGLDEKDVIFRELNSSAVSMLQNIYSELKCVLPYAVCTTCQGHQKKKCTLCKGRGFISHFAYSQFVPEETKAIREAGRNK